MGFTCLFLNPGSLIMSIVRKVRFMLLLPQTTEIQESPRVVQPKAPEHPETKPQIKAEPLTFNFRAAHLSEVLKLKEIAKLFDLKPLVFNPTRLVYQLSENCFCFFYNFGSVVFFNVDEAAQQSTLDRLKNFSPGNRESVTSDEFLMEVEKKAKNAVFFEKVVVDKLSREKIELMALVLAQSTALEYFENKVEEIWSQMGTIPSKKIRPFIDQAMTTKQNLIGTLYLLEKPEETWESKILDDLHQEATMMFELKERFRTLDYKLRTIQENLEILANFTTNRQHLLLEWAIVGLIVAEVILFCYQLFFK